jgi:hypothetical protein
MNPLTPIEPGEPGARAATEAGAITNYCRTCGRGLTAETRRMALGTFFCEEHVPHVSGETAADPPSPYAQAPQATGTSAPILAFILGLIPGVGAIFNGQYAKGFIHVVIFGLLVSAVESPDLRSGLEPLFGMMIAAFVFYQAFEAYHTAKAKAAGVPVDEFSSILPVPARSGVPLAPVVLIVLGVLFLLANFGYLRLAQLIRFWPVLLIALGVSMMLNRMRGGENRE